MDSPLRDAFAFPASPEEQFRLEADYDNSLEEALATCMTRSGFVYLPTQLSASDQLDEAGFGLERQEYVERLGFNIVEGWAGSVASSDVSSGLEQDGFETMSEAERRQYLVALEGEAYVAELEGGDQESLKVGGCRAAAVSDVERPVWLDSVDEYLSQANVVEGFLEADPLVQALWKRWASCMAGEGFPDLQQPAAAYDAVLGEFWDVLDGLEFLGGPGPGEDVIASLSSASRQRLDEFADGGPVVWFLCPPGSMVEIRTNPGTVDDSLALVGELSAALDCVR